MLKLPDGTVKVLVEGRQRAMIESVGEEDECFVGAFKPLSPEAEESTETEAMRRALLAQFEQYVKLNKKIPPEVLNSLAGIDRAGRMADTIIAHLPLKLEQKQEVLEMFDVQQRLEHLMSQLEGEIDILQVEKRIRGRVKRQMEKSQREYYLNEQVKAIQKELGEMDEVSDLDELENKIKAAGMSKEGREKAMSELKKLRMMSPMSAEATVVRNYIDTLLELPWKKKTKISKDVAKAEEVLDEDHFGLERSRNVFWSTWRCNSASTSSRRPFCAWWDRRAWARPRWASRWRAPPTASSCAWRWAGCATSPRSAAIAAPISARCRARCCRT